MTSEKWTAGQEVLIHEPNYRQAQANPRRVVVDRVARKYVYVKVYGHDVAFDKLTGWERTEYLGAASQIMTQAEWDDRDRRRDVIAELKERNFGTARGFGSWDYSTDTLQKVLDVLKSVDDDPAGGYS